MPNVKIRRGFMQVAEIELYEILKTKLGEKEAKTLVEYIEAKVGKELEEKKDILATKEDINALRAATKEDINGLKIEIEKVRTGMVIEIEKVRTGMVVEIEKVRTEMVVEIEKVRTEMEKTRSDIIKWMFLFWIGQVASLFAILQIFFRK